MARPAKGIAKKRKAPNPSHRLIVDETQAHKSSHIALATATKPSATFLAWLISFCLFNKNLVGEGFKVLT
jgi:hypothetical protein